MSTLLRLGPFGQAKATAALAANVAVMWDASNPGQIVVCTTGSIPIGYTQDAYAAGAMATFVRAMKGIELLATGSGVAAGDLVKCTTVGALAPEAGVTTATAATIGQAITASDANNNFVVTPL